MVSSVHVSVAFGKVRMCAGEVESSLAWNDTSKSWQKVVSPLPIQTVSMLLLDDPRTAFVGTGSVANNSMSSFGSSVREKTSVPSAV